MGGGVNSASINNEKPAILAGGMVVKNCQYGVNIFIPFGFRRAFL
jgi:hypothetical protein